LGAVFRYHYKLPHAFVLFMDRTVAKNAIAMFLVMGVIHLPTTERLKNDAETTTKASYLCCVVGSLPSIGLF